MYSSGTTCVAADCENAGVAADCENAGVAADCENAGVADIAAVAAPV